MGFTFDFGFEAKGASWSEAYLALLFACDGEPADLGRTPGPLAVADASRYVELFEMQVGLSPLNIGTYAEVVGGSNPFELALQRSHQARSRGMFPVVVASDRRVTPVGTSDPLVAFWGTVGRTEADEAAILAQRRTILAGVRSATSAAFQSIPSTVTILAARSLMGDRETLRSALEQIEHPVHLSIDLDVLAPSVAQTPRSIEPGGLAWYDLMDAMELVFQGPGVATAELVGTGLTDPRSATSTLSAQILLRLAGLLAIGLGE